MTLKKAGIIIADLKKRSEKGLELAKQTLQAEKIECPKLHDALEHYIAYWNDFTHPGLFSIACEAAGGDPDRVVQTQAAIATMAAAFDIHDDIIDKSKVKYKIPTVYGKFGAEIAILLGNAFLIEGFKLLVDSTTMLPKEKERRVLEAVKKLMFEVGNAHALEVGLKERKNVAPNDYMKIIEMKAAGIEVDIHLGALFGGEDAEVEALARLGRILGILATLRDEFIDVFETEELWQRISTQSLPLPVLLALRDQEAKGTVMSIISKPEITKSDVNELVDVILEAKTVVKLKHKMRLLIREGADLSNHLRKEKLRRSFQILLSFMLEDL
jgi:geranylgeranyl pyrophosphate synthase